MQFFKADPMIAFLSPCLLFVMPKSLSAVEHPGNFAYSTGKFTVIVHNSNVKRCLSYFGASQLIKKHLHAHFNAQK